jgi:hypothetical protein
MKTRNSAAAEIRPNLAQEGDNLLAHETAGHQAVRKAMLVSRKDTIIKLPYSTFQRVCQLRPPNVKGNRHQQASGTCHDGEVKLEDILKNSTYLIRSASPKVKIYASYLVVGPCLD